jgi:hypothetical protein
VEDGLSTALSGITEGQLLGIAKLTYDHTNDPAGDLLGGSRPEDMPDQETLNYAILVRLELTPLALLPRVTELV